MASERDAQSGEIPVEAIELERLDPGQAGEGPGPWSLGPGQAGEDKAACKGYPLILLS